MHHNSDSMRGRPSIDDWADAQARISATRMGAAISATSMNIHRPGFGQIVRPAKGSVLAATSDAKAGREPDYFFHWVRDSAIAMDAALHLISRGISADVWRRNFADFTIFSLTLQQIDGPDFLKNMDIRARTEPELRQYLRSDSEIATIKGEAVLGDTRYNVDGTLDFLKWSRPQHDGPAARALVALRFVEANALLSAVQEKTAELIRSDLQYTAKHLCEPCFDIWEEELGQHYHTCLLQYAALQRGALWAIAKGEDTFAAGIGAATDWAREVLESFWSSHKCFYLSRIMAEGQATTKELDFSVILAVLRAGLPDGRHSIMDERVARTMHRLEKLFAAEYAINRGATAALAFGRYSGDRYFSGGAYYLCTFGAAEFYYKLAMAKSDDCFIDRGDSILEFARGSIPSSGEISEQFDQATGEQTSARSLTWGYASFITAWSARRNALARLRPGQGSTS